MKTALPSLCAAAALGALALGLSGLAPVPAERPAPAAANNSFLAALVEEVRGDRRRELFLINALATAAAGTEQDALVVRECLLTVAKRGLQADDINSTLSLSSVAIASQLAKVDGTARDLLVIALRSPREQVASDALLGVDAATLKHPGLAEAVEAVATNEKFHRRIRATARNLLDQAAKPPAGNGK